MLAVAFTSFNIRILSTELLLVGIRRDTCGIRSDASRSTSFNALWHNLRASPPPQDPIPIFRKECLSRPLRTGRNVTIRRIFSPVSGTLMIAADGLSCQPSRPREREWVSELNPKFSGGSNTSLASTVRLNCLLCPGRFCEAVALKSVHAPNGVIRADRRGEHSRHPLGCARGRLP